jgi:(2Fe-2S) ferredoxin
MYAKVTKEQVAEIFDQHLQGGRPIDALKVSPEFW